MKYSPERDTAFHTKAEAALSRLPAEYQHCPTSTHMNLSFDNQKSTPTWKFCFVICDNKLRLKNSWLVLLLHNFLSWVVIIILILNKYPPRKRWGVMGTGKDPGLGLNFLVRLNVLGPSPSLKQTWTSSNMMKWMTVTSSFYSKILQSKLIEVDFDTSSTQTHLH